MIIPRNTFFENFRYWARRIFLFWKFPKVTIELPVQYIEWLKNSSKERNMCVSQFASKVLTIKIKELENADS